ncbi:ribosome maturation factor RimP [Gordonia sp. CPCC 206044]|uniref:ribosome maturation factor RimP n=1 Tax=Gordonia sp. CPCC 206044 TaxID=3140793 RepID=UPI003AF3D7D0
MSISAEQITDLVEPIVGARGFDLEDVAVATAAGRTDVTVVVDRDGGSDLDVLADLSREISERLDDEPDLADAAYVLEVTSPGVDRPLTLPRHWRRAVGRKVAAEVADANGDTRRIVGRVGPIDDDRVRLVLNERGRIRTEEIALDAITTAVVQVDFSRPSTAELELCGLSEDEISRRRSDT